MPVKFTEKSLPGVFIIEPTVFKDDRGFFLETYHREKYAEIGVDQAFVQDNRSRSTRRTLRGLHYQLHHPQGKLVYVTSGKVLDVAADKLDTLHIDLTFVAGEIAYDARLWE